MSCSNENLLREIPSVSQVLAADGVRTLVARFGDGAVKLELRAVLDDMRQQMRAGRLPAVPSTADIMHDLEARLVRLTQPIGRRAINATGILLHTGLGRAPLCSQAAEALVGGTNYSVLQASLERGDRSLREEKIQRLLIELVGCQAATIVNNNAAATMLILNTLAAGKEVVISRGQLIEIGGSFRMTEVMSQSGATLREVGTTNRTHLRDYESAISDNTCAIIHVHTSNYRIRGFTGTPDIAELVALGRKRQIPVIDDLGSGALVPLSKWGLADEPLVRDSLAAGADVVCFSGDKLISGPQAGIICGKTPVIDKIRKNPYARMFRVCKLTLAATEATLLHFINGTHESAIPFYLMLSRQLADLQRDADKVAGELGRIGGLRAVVADDIAYVGSGSLPDEGIATKTVRIIHERIDSDELAKRLRLGVPSVFGRLSDHELVLDMRTLLEGEVELLIEAVKRAV